MKLLLYLYFTAFPVVNGGNQEFSSRTLGVTWGIIAAVMVPILVVLICIGWRILLRKKQEEREENEFLAVRTRPIDPDESLKINSDDDSIPYKKDAQDSPEPTEAVKIADIDNQGFSYPQPYTENLPPLPPPQPQTNRQWSGETEIN